MPETRDSRSRGRLDAAGAALCVLGLGGLTAGIIAVSNHPLSSAGVWLPLVVGVAGLAGFVAVERLERNALLPPSLFGSRLFAATNAVTFLLYAANGAALLLLVVELQTVTGFSPLEAGTALLPITVIMLGLAARFGALSRRTGPRLLTSVGPVVSATGLALFTTLSSTSSYWRNVLPAVAVFGLGLAIFVAPLTATVLGAVPASHAGVASGVNNAVARAASLLAIAALPVIAGLTGRAYESASLYLPAFRTAMWICVGLQLAAAALAALTVPSTHLPTKSVPGHSVTLAGEPASASPR